VITVLTNRAYVGEIFFRGRYHPAPHPRLVDAEMFETAQAILESRGEDMWAWTPTEPTSCPSGRCRTQAIRPACSSGGPAHDLNTAADGILNAVRPNPPVELADPFSAADRLGEGLGPPHRSPPRGRRRRAAPPARASRPARGSSARSRSLPSQPSNHAPRRIGRPTAVPSTAGCRASSSETDRNAHPHLGVHDAVGDRDRRNRGRGGVTR
jgi:hypothetical protein